MNYRTNFIYLKFVIWRLIRKIKPDLIHLHGTEVDYSSSIFQFKKKYPILITIQGFVSHATNKDDYFIKRRINVEQLIFRRFIHFGYRTRTMGNDILKYCPNAVLNWHHYPISEINCIVTEKKFDLVFFARVTKDKGIEDLLKGIALIKKSRPDISLCIIGGTNNKYIDYLRELANKLDISDNITWTGYIPKQSDMFKIASSSRISVLPTHQDIISGTIIESMFLRLPVVAYNVGSIYEINETGQFINLIDKGDIIGMADKIISLLKHPEELAVISEKAYNRALEMFDNKHIHSDLTNAYNQVINDFYASKK
jgi:glycosyltransferase involved in cell wall biosynthesis